MTKDKNKKIDVPQLLKEFNDHTRNLNNFPPRQYLGLSSIGDECVRKIFYRWRFAKYEVFPPRLYRLFARGGAEEDRFIDLFRGAGIPIFPVNPATRKQFEVTLFQGHVKGHLDGIIWINGEWWLVEMKTASHKSWMKFQRAKDLSVSNFEYYAQTQMYMNGYNLKKCLWIVVNKDNDNLYAEIVKYDKECYTAMYERCGELLTTATIPQGCSQDSTYYKCAYCWFQGLCYDNEKPNSNCRLCQNVELMPDGKWSCKLTEEHIMLGITEQRLGCKLFKLMEG